MIGATEIQTMPSIETTFEAAVADKIIPGAVLVASSTDGSFFFYLDYLTTLALLSVLFD